MTRISRRLVEGADEVELWLDPVFGTSISRWRKAHTKWKKDLANAKKAAEYWREVGKSDTDASSLTDEELTDAYNNLDGASDEVRESITAEYKKRFGKGEEEAAAPAEVAEDAAPSENAETEGETSETVVVRTDSQGNPLSEDGTLKLEKVASIDDIADEDFTNPTRNIELPTLPDEVDGAIGANVKSVIIKKNILERNIVRHSDLTAEDSRNILKAALYTPDLYGQNQKANRPYNWVVINTKDKDGNNRLVLIELSPEKENAEIVHWHYIDKKGLDKIRRQAEREDGQLLILPSESEEAGALSSPTNGLSSGGKVSENDVTEQTKAEKNAAPNVNSSVEPAKDEVELWQDPVLGEGFAKPYSNEFVARAPFTLAVSSLNQRGKISEDVAKKIERAVELGYTPTEEQIAKDVDGWNLYSVNSYGQAYEKVAGMEGAPEPVREFARMMSDGIP